MQEDKENVLPNPTPRPASNGVAKLNICLFRSSEREIHRHVPEQPPLQDTLKTNIKSFER